MKRNTSDSGRTEWPAGWAWVLLIIAMAISSAAVLVIAKDIRFTADEMTLISKVAELGPRELFEPYVGHLVLIPLLAYKAVIETLGTTSYAPFQIMTLVSIFLLGAGTLVWGSRRLPQSIALVPAILLLFFPADVLHFIAGNGFTVVLPLALGVWALVLWDRETVIGDLGAAVLLAMAISTYTVGVAFAVGLAVAALIGARRRIWVAGVPLLGYALWRVVLTSKGIESEGADPNWANLMLLPAWAFQSAGDIIVAISGVGFDFARAKAAGNPTPMDYASPIFAAGFAALIVFGFRRGRIGVDFLVVSAIALALFASQVLVWGSLDGRGGPGEERYLYPGAVVILLMSITLGRAIDWDRGSRAVLWLSTSAALISAGGFLINEVNRREIGTGIARAQVTAMQILATSSEAPPFLDRAKTVVRNEFDPGATSRLEGLGFDEESLQRARSRHRAEVDRFMATALGLGFEPVEPGARSGPCRTTAGGSGSIRGRFSVPRGGAILESGRDLELGLGRFDAGASLKLGSLPARRPVRLDIPADEVAKPWFIEVDSASTGTAGDLVICLIARP